MPLAYKNVGVTVKSDLPDKNEAVEHVFSILCKEGVAVYADPERMEDVPCVKKHPQFSPKTPLDLLVVIGGDGTILRVVREMPEHLPPILSINKGAIGFLAEISFEEAHALIPHFLQGKGAIEERQLLHISAHRKNKKLFDGHVLNEAVIAQGAIARLLDLKTEINHEPLTTFHADGLIIATPTGSTAYSLAAGGPIVHPKISAMILTPLNAHSFAQKPIVIPGNQSVRVEVNKKVNKFLDTEVSLTLDGQAYFTLLRDDVVEAHVSDRKVKFLRRAEDTFYGTLRTKLKWGERLED
ncbi:NAD(+)/NADH kinase [Candidatus Peregrinibacteria bacterium]|nr:NAD(+)/NADH kinase [Candidatus Peregrinibacteria bacterium]